VHIEFRVGSIGMKCSIRESRFPYLAKWNANMADPILRKRYEYNR